jgi:protein-disulfide isomerase
VQEATLQPLEETVDHVRGGPGGHLILEYGDYECPYSRKAFRAIQQLEGRLGAGVRFAFRHFPLTEVHPHALAASEAAEAAARQERFWPMHELLFHRQLALEDEDLRRYAAELGLDVERFDRDRAAGEVAERVLRDVQSGIAAGVQGTPTLFLDGIVHTGSYDADTLAQALSSPAPSSSPSE